MPTTAKLHFDQDISRAQSLLDHASALENGGDTSQLPKDIRGAGLSLAVGAMDAYFCDKYVDCISKALSTYAAGNWKGTFPAAYRKKELPAGEVLDASRPNRPKWGIRMAARSAMEKDFMYSLSRISDAFNGILPPGQKLWDGIVDDLAALNRKRFTKYTRADLAALSGKSLQDARKRVSSKARERIGITVQFRHDWIHNCSRPKAAIVNYTKGEALAAKNEIQSLIDIIESHIEAHRLV